MKRILQIALPIAILALSAALVIYLISSHTVPEQRRFQTPAPEVVARPLQKVDYPVVLRSQGTVQARTQSALVSEVRGRIVSISPNFRDGAFFEEGEELARIDESDYQTELVVAESNLSQAQLRLFEEKARYDQARSDWDKLHPGVEPNELVLREPQLRQAQSSVDAAAARVENSRINLDRTRIKAPYAGRILNKSVDVGQFVSAGSALARVYAVDFAEVRLPLTSNQTSYLDLPSVYRGDNPEFASGPRVRLKAKQGAETYEWMGRIVRAEGSIDVRSRQLFVIAQVRDPYGRQPDGKPPLKVGSFVEAEIDGKTIRDVYVVPRKLLRENSFLLLLDKDRYLHRRTVNIVWQNDDIIVVDKGLSEGELLCMTNVPFALEGWQVAMTMESDAKADLVAGSEDPAQKRRPAAPAASAGGGFAASILAAIPPDKQMPAALKEKLDTAMASGGGPAMRPIMQEIRAWAESEGIKLPSGGGPR